MKALLVATNRERSPYPVAPLGALCVAAAARAAGHEVTFLDLGTERKPQKALRQALATDKFQAVAFGIRNLDNCWSFAPRLYFDEVRELAETVRQRFAGPLILGGTGFSVSPQGWMQRLMPECGVIGEGEHAFPEVLARLEAKRPLEGIEGVITGTGTNGPGVMTARAIEPLARLPAPAHELCRYPRYLRRGGFVGVQTKRGCPFKCAYCIYPKLEGRRYRLRPPEAVVGEMAAVVARGKSRHFFFVDSVFNDPRHHALAICRELARRRLPVQWLAFCNPTGFDAELAHAMKESGCHGVEFGLDVASDKMLAALNKPFGQEETRIALQAAHDAGLPIAIYLLFGGPGETWADVEDTQNFLNSCARANAVFATVGIRVYEGTPMADVAVREGQVRPDQDLFEPAYYLSPGLADNTERNLDRIARRRAEWTSPVDWRKAVVRLGQKITVLLNVRPQWKNISSYGKHVRRSAS
ncbi:MAG TPA: radical SAM protein [Candidatus Sulfopaludibacter sp.]|nr:radical SAM protein [Candidatus Sulfopaludibacter sp.]